MMFARAADFHYAHDRSRGNAALHKPDCADRSRLAGIGSRNGLLSLLPGAAMEELEPLLERVPLKRRQVLHERNLPIGHAYFIEAGLASLMARTGEQGTLEVGTLGSKDLVGMPLVLGASRTPYRCIVQVPGEALRIEAEDLRQALERIPALRTLLLKYVQASTVQSTQLVVCNTSHTLQQRLARWLLVADDRLEGNEIPVTHQFLGRALGVRRAGVTTAIGRMEELGLLRRGRGRIGIVDREQLEDISCECFRTIRAEHRRMVCDELPEPALHLVRQ